MPLFRLRIHPILIAGFVCTLAALRAERAGASEPSPPNVRPMFLAGAARPLEFEGLDHGFSFGLGFEIEQSALLSFVAHAEFSKLSGLVPDYPYPASQEGGFTTWTVGLRVHPLDTRLHPYSDLRVGVRMERDPNVTFDERLPFRRNVRYEGPVGAIHLGVCSASTGGAGLFVEAGLQVVLRNPERFALVPLTFGVVFP